MPRIVLYTIVLGMFLLFGGAVPAAAQGSNPPSLFPALCPKNTTSGDPTETKVFVDGETTDVTIKDFLAKKMYCPNACFSQRITISRTQVKGKEAVQFKVVGANDCTDATKLPKDQTPPRGCQVGQTQPKVTVDVPKISYSIPLLGEQILLAAQTVGPKSRCDAGNITDRINTIFDKLETRSPGQIKTAQNDIDALKSTPNTTTPLPNDLPLPGTPQPAGTAGPGVATEPKPQTDSEALQQMLRDRYGVPADQAKSVVENDPDKVKEMVQKSLTNDTAGAQQIARQLGLNDDVIKNIAHMTPPEQITPEQAAEIARAEQERLNGNTFDTQVPAGGLATQCGTPGLAGNIMYAESRCARINSNPLSSVQGPYHFLCGTWTAYAQSTGNGQYADCVYRNDPAISTQVMNAKMDQFGNMYGAQCTQAGLSLTSCQYAIHVFGETGFKRVFNAYLNDPNNSAYSLCGSALRMDACTNNISIFKNGGTVAGVFGELDRRLGGNSTRIGSIAPVSSSITGFSSGSGSVYDTGGPFSGTGFFNLGNYSTGGSTSYGSFFSGFFSGLTGRQTVPVQPSQVPYPNQPQTQAVVSLIAQPSVSYPGGNIVVSWSSVGMRADHPCVTRMVTRSASSTIGNSNEGSVVTSASVKGVVTFAITCTALTGQGVVQTATVSVQ